MIKNINRENNFDLLRIVATFAVILVHTGNFFFVNFDSVVGKFFEVFFKFAVPLFLMLSGTFIFRKKINVPEFYKKAGKKLGIPLIIASFLYLIIDFFHEIKIGLSIIDAILETIYLLCKGTPFYHLWYMYMLIGLYMIIPVLQMIKDYLSNRAFNCFIYFMLIWGALSIWTIDFKVVWNGQFLAYIGYFLLGYKIKNFDSPKNSIKYFLLGIFILVLNWILYLFFENYISNLTLEKLFMHRLSPLIIVASIYFFIGFCNLKVKRYLFKISEKTYLIYLFHAVYLLIIGFILKIFYRESGAIDIGCIIIVSIIIFILSYITSILYNNCEKILIKNFNKEKKTRAI